MYYNVSEVPGILLLFVSTFCDILFFDNLMYNAGHFVQSMPTSVIIQNLASYFHLSRNMWTTAKFICYFWKSLTFMKFCGDKRISISNASWEILNRMFFNRISKYNGGYQVTMVTEKRISRLKRRFFYK